MKKYGCLVCHAEMTVEEYEKALETYHRILCERCEAREQARTKRG